MAARRSLITLMIFTAALLCAVAAPRIGFALICCALLSYLVPEMRGLHFNNTRPERRGAGPERARHAGSITV